MVHQISFVVTGIRSTIAEIETFKFFYLPKDYAEKNRSSSTVALATSGKAGRRKSSLRMSKLVNVTTFSEDHPRKSVQFEVAPIVRPCREYFSKLELLRNEKVVYMKKLFESIGPTLVKLESLILGTYTGNSPKMKQYYTFWEKELFTLLIK